MSDTTLNWKTDGSRVAQVIPLVENTANGKYKLPTTVEKYLIDYCVKGTGLKIPKPDSSSSEDTFKSLTDTANNTFRVKINPKTYTHSGGTLTEESGTTSGSKTYPEVTIVAGNTPLLKSGTAEAVRTTLTQFINAQAKWQKTPCIIVHHIGRIVGASTPAGFSYSICKLTSDVVDTEDGATMDGTTLTFTAGSYELDDTLDLTTINGLFEDITPFGGTTAIQITDLVADDVTAIKAGSLIVK